MGDKELQALMKGEVVLDDGKTVDEVGLASGGGVQAIFGDWDFSFRLNSSVEWRPGSWGCFVDITAAPLSAPVEDFKPRWWDNDENRNQTVVSSEMDPSSLKQKCVTAFQSVWQRDPNRSQSPSALSN